MNLSQKCQSLVGRWWASSRKSVRISDADALKGIGALLTVLLHSIKANQYHGYANFQLYNSISAFLVPLFVFVSGFLTNLTDDESVGAFVVRKALRYVLPYFAWFYVGFWQPDGNSIGSRVACSGTVRECYESVRDANGYLLAVFGYTLMLAAYKRSLLERRLTPAGSLLLAAACHAARHASPSAWWLLTVEHAGYFFVGYAVQHHAARLVRLQSAVERRLLVAAACDAALCLVAYATVGSWRMDAPRDRAGAVVGQHLVAFVGICAAYRLARRLSLLPFVYDPICFLGTRAIDVYVVSPEVVYKKLSEPHRVWYNIGIVFGMTLFKTLFISLNYIRGLPWLALLLLGCPPLPPAAPADSHQQQPPPDADPKKADDLEAPATSSEPRSIH
eukprot:TRINITY_DN4211_c0_g1_i1.p3 TRINITY_DN4211_c0_g1~~TRINITY_DN4211_c0_g1_i1.p3  ORF type:complete len:390 (+),score=114.86 TRINITY_DN4211_c0_g1_i1:1573-2742(+)